MTTKPDFLHRRILKHPFTILVLLCVGLLLLGSTFHSKAETIEVTAKVPAAPLTQPAVITSLSDGEHVTTEQVTVAGTCPADSYVKLYINDQYAGVAQCSGGSFSIPATLAPGPNKLQVRVFNSTDDEGPTSPPITVYYDKPSPTPQTPPTPPESLTVTSLDGSNYKEGILRVLSIYPTFTGFAPPFSRITITIHSEPRTCETKANAYGWWTCTFYEPLEPGLHTVYITAVTPRGTVLRFPPFQILIVAGHIGLWTPPKPGEGSQQLRVISEYKYQTHIAGERWSWEIGIAGGVGPYKVTVDWGDGTSSSWDRSDGSTFTISHAYQSGGSFSPLITVTDKNGTKAVLQMLAVVKGPPAAQTTQPSFLAWLKQYLWAIWPIYLIILLMAISFWLGEQEILKRRSARQDLPKS